MAKDVIVALDFPGEKEVFEFLDRFREEKPYVKIGMELFYALGPNVVREIKARGHKIFLDLKLHDIPNTVRSAMASLSKLDDDYVVFTDYDKSADFGEYLTYYMPDSVLLITNNEKATYWTNEDADYILETFADNMAARGFTLVDSKEDADLGLQVSYIEVISSIIPMTIGGGDIPDIGDPDIGDHIGTVGIIPIP